MGSLLMAGGIPTPIGTYMEKGLERKWRGKGNGVAAALEYLVVMHYFAHDYAYGYILCQKSRYDI